ncbi:MAG TPA: DUF6691 family protein [Polyangiaceae bacterium]|jgi:uncharacterized membrane protein YedE/YeeE|nr:DUF6691 family protein [Polyangiaceae bacterium]
MSRSTQQWLTAFASGLLFGAGLLLGGMTDPRKVIGFLDVAGAWDPSLAFVMLGAVVVHFIAYRWARGSASPLFADEFAIPKLRHIDAKLVGGSAVFGVGWGLAGYCPGPGIVSLGAGSRDALVFVITMLIGMLLSVKYEARQSRASTGAQPARA